MTISINNFKKSQNMGIGEMFCKIIIIIIISKVPTTSIKLHVFSWDRAQGNNIHFYHSFRNPCQRYQIRKKLSKVQKLKKYNLDFNYLHITENLKDLNFFFRKISSSRR